jgi:DNA-binding transcriptional LysR family regulator
MTPTQLRAYAAVVRLGSVKAAAHDLDVTEAAVSLNVRQLRLELGDKLFTPTSSGLAFTPGGLRLARRAVEMLGLQDRTVDEVRSAGSGRRLLRVASSSLFAEYAAPGLLALFAERAADLDVELSIHRPATFEDILISRTADVAIGPRPAGQSAAVATTHFLNYQVVAVVGREHPFARVQPSISMLRDETWLLGPSAVPDSGEGSNILRKLGVPEERQQIYQSHAAALEEVKRSHGVALAVSFAVSKDLATGSLVRLTADELHSQHAWSISCLADQLVPQPAAELTRFVLTPRATQAMVRGAGVGPGRFKPAVHVTLWS